MAIGQFYPADATTWENVKQFQIWGQHGMGTKESKQDKTLQEIEIYDGLSQLSKFILIFQNFILYPHALLCIYIDYNI